MLVDTITFEMHNTAEKFVVPNTELNYELIAANRFTRQIKFTKTFSFQVTKEINAPAFFVESLVNAYLEEIAEMENSEPYCGDEMHGDY